MILYEINCYFIFENYIEFVGEFLVNLVERSFMLDLVFFNF